jgi:mRNA interferase RelE/StbE
LAAEVFYKASALKDLKRLDRSAARRILDKIDADLAAHPGKDKALSGQYKGLFSYRVGDYRVVYAMLRDAILVLRVAHRADAYRQD